MVWAQNLGSKCDVHCCSVHGRLAKLSRAHTHAHTHTHTHATRALQYHTSSKPPNTQIDMKPQDLIESERLLLPIEVIYVHNMFSILVLGSRLTVI